MRELADSQPSLLQQTSRSIDAGKRDFTGLQSWAALSRAQQVFGKSVTVTNPRGTALAAFIDRV